VIDAQDPGREVGFPLTGSLLRRIQAWKGVYHSESTVSGFTALWKGRYPFAAFRVRRLAEFPEPRPGSNSAIWGVGELRHLSGLATAK
jgi:hypothetical protein